MSLNTLNNWASTFLSKHVQNIAHGGDFLSSESVVLFAGPPTWDDAGAPVSTDLLTPIGLVQNAQITQQKQVQQMYEIGSRKPINVPGRVRIQGSISRILFDGPSLMAVLNIRTNPNNTTFEIPNLAATEQELNEFSVPTQPFALNGSATFGNTGNTGEFWINLASNLFNSPLGLGFALYDMQKEAYGGFYLEECYIASHQFGVSAGATVLAENVSFLATQMRPLAANFITV